jgi:hypothetical protein
MMRLIMFCRAIIFASVVLSVSSTEAKTPLNASCAEFLGAASEDVPLYNGIALGFVASRIGYADEMKTMFEAERVIHLTRSYCAKKPADLVVKVMEFWSGVVKKMPFPEAGNN